jgi:hypothetical protein
MDVLEQPPSSRRGRKRRRQRCRITVVELDDEPAQASSLLARRVLRHRERRGLPSTTAPPPKAQEEQGLNVWTLCDDYGGEDYGAMDDDVHRNAAYSRAFEAVGPHQNRWLEIGCGASATLTRLALRSAPAGTHITAFEVNPQSAAAAAEGLRRDGLDRRARVVLGKSTQPELLLENPRAAAAARQFHVVLHEVFGIFVSSEGCPQMLQHARAQYLSAAAARRQGGLIPSRCATFFTPCALRPASLDTCESLLCNSTSRPTLLLAPAAPLADMALCNTSAALEVYDFGSDEPLDTEQAHQHEFIVSKDSELNCLGCFVWVDLGIGEPAPRTDDASGGSARFESRFPFGDSAVSGALGCAGQQQLNDFTSLCTTETLSNCTYASNWQNPLLLLPATAKVRRGDRICVRTRALANTLTPSYHFDVTHRPANGGGGAVSLGTLSVTFDDLYPDYGDF